MKTGFTGGGKIAPVAELKIPGRHNRQNALAAVAAAKVMDLPAETIRRGLAAFAGVEHRLEFVGEYRGIRFYNDSKATNPESTRIALNSFAGESGAAGRRLRQGRGFPARLPACSGTKSGCWWPMAQRVRRWCGNWRKAVLPRQFWQRTWPGGFFPGHGGGRGPGTSFFCRRRAPAGISTKILKSAAGTLSLWSPVGGIKCEEPTTSGYSLLCWRHFCCWELAWSWSTAPAPSCPCTVTTSATIFCAGRGYLPLWAWLSCLSACALITGTGAAFSRRLLT